jgi:hypothetical protein
MIETLYAILTSEEARGTDDVADNLTKNLKIGFPWYDKELEQA